MTSPSGGSGRGDILRKAAIVVVLVAGLAALYQVGRADAEFDPTGLLALGFVVLASYTVGQLFVSVGLPPLTGYLIAGMLVGPSMGKLLPVAWQIAPFDQGVLNAEVLGQLKILDTLAISLIALAAGGELKADEIRRHFGAFLAFCGTIVGVSWPVFALALWVALGPLALLDLGDLGGTPLWALALVTAPLILATSPAVTIAVVTSTGARGPWTQRVLATVVLLDVCIPTMFSLVAAVTAPGSGEGASLMSVLGGHLAGSLVVGVLVGLGTALYLEYVAAELLLFLVGAIYVVTYASVELHLESILVFIAAGFTVANFSRHGETLLHAVEQLSLPTYVVFFTLTGASVKLDEFASMAVLAIPFAFLRFGVMWGAVQVGGRLAGWQTDRLPILGFSYISQAGVAIGLANLLGQTYGEAGRSLGTLCIAIVTLNQLVGPVILSWVFSAFKEVPGSEAPAAQEQPQVAEDGAEWGADLGGIAELRSPMAQLRDKVQGWAPAIVRPIDKLSEEAHGMYRELRLEFHRGHRAALSSGHLGPAPAEARARLAASWRRVLSKRSKRVILDGPWIDLIRSMDQSVDELPAWLSAEVQDESAVVEAEDGLLVRAGKLTLKARLAVARLVGWRVQRAVPAKQLGRFYLGGRLVGDLEPVVAHLLALEIESLQRVLPVFEAIDAHYTQAALVQGEEQSKRMVEAREEADRALVGLSRWIDEETTRRRVEAERALAGNWQAMVADLRQIGTPGHSAWSVRLSKIHGARKAVLAKLVGGLPEAREAFELYGGAVALGLELHEVESRIEHEVRHGARALARQVAARGHDRLVVVGGTLDRMLARIGEIGGDSGGTDAITCLAEIVAHEEPLLGSAARDTGSFRTGLRDGGAIQDLIERLLAIGAELPERVRIPQDPWLSGSTLPEATRAVDVPARSVVTDWVEMEVHRELLASCESQAARLDEVASVLEELALLVKVNLGLAQSEIEARGDGPVGDSVGDTLLLPLRRFRWRVAQLERDSQEWSDEIEARISGSVEGALEILRKTAFQGMFSGLRQRVLREVEARRLWVVQGGSPVLAAKAALLDAERWYVARYGAKAALRLRERLGVPVVKGPERVERFRPAEPAVEVPAVYRRLFTAERLDLGQAMMGREADGHRALAALQRGPVRAVGVVGWPGVGRRGFARRVASEVGGDVKFLGGKGRVDQAEVEAFFDALAPGEVAVIEGIDRLWRPGPGGDAAAAAVARRGARHGGPWLATGSPAAWEMAQRFSAIGDLFPTRVSLGPWSEADLRSQLLIRHGLSGYRVAFEGEDLDGKEDEGLRQRWFARIHEESGGLFEDALRLWLGSVVRVDESYGVVLLGEVPASSQSALASLEDGSALVLHQLVLRGSLDAAGHSALFGTPMDRSEAAMMALVHLGVVDREGQDFVMARHLVGPWVRVMRERGWRP